MLWLSLHFPHLALEIFTRAAVDPTVPFLVSDHRGASQWVHARNRAAAACGVSLGMSLGAAQALLSHYRTLPRRPDSEAEALVRLADWAGQFTSLVSLVPPQGLLMEIGGSLQLFDGIDKLRHRILEELEALGFRAVAGIAPTPLGATLLARAGKHEPVMDKGTLRRTLAVLPIEILEDIGADRIAAFRGMGVRTVEELLRLPRAGLARRFGPEAIQYLLQAFGDLPDPRPAHVTAPCYSGRLVLPSEVDNTQALLFAARRLLLELVGFLRARGSGIQQIALELHHHSRDPSRLMLGLLAPGRDLEHLQSLLRTRLESFVLPAPVDELRLGADDLITLEGENSALFAPVSKSGEGRLLIERLQARLGKEAVYGCAIVADHRPERACRYLTPGTPNEMEPPFGLRPLWLLPTPELLEMRDGRPCRHGPLRLLQGPERIEAGWWDGGAARDYFIAEDGHHLKIWIYREPRGENKNWFLHGIFS